MEEQKSSQNPPINRRELLKALAAGSSALAASAFLPGKWVRPIVEGGVLPAHAQASCPFTMEITDAGVNFNTQFRAEFFVSVAWLPATAFSVVLQSLTYGGVATEVVHSDINLTTGTATFYFNPGAGAEDTTIIITLLFNRVCELSDQTSLQAPTR